MEQPENSILAEIEGLGRIYNCGNCSHIHFQLGPMSLTLTVGAYMQLVDMVNTSAANFERHMVWDGDVQ